jgi:hypothetical protein
MLPSIFSNHRLMHHNYFADEQVLAAEGITDLDKYSVVPELNCIGICLWMIIYSCWPQ